MALQGQRSTPTSRDGGTTIRLLSPRMRLMLMVASALVFGAGLPLTLFSERTDAFFAWTIQPPLTAAFLGAGYWSSGVLELLAARQRVWAYARVAVPAVLLFTTLTLVATLLHLDRFHLTASDPVTLAVTWAWLAIYAGVPPVMGLLLILQLRRPGGDPPRSAPLPRWTRLVITLQGIILLGLGTALFLLPGATLGLWPWTLTPLTARAVGAWLLGLGVAASQVARENDLRGAWPMLLTVPIFCALQATALARYPATIAWDRPSAWLYVGFLLSLTAVCLLTWPAAQRIGPNEVDVS